MTQTFTRTLVGMALCALAVVPASAGPLATLQASPVAVEWQPALPGAGLTLTVSGPEGFYLRQELAPGKSPSFSVFGTDGSLRPAGVYVWELRAVFELDAETRQELEAVRQSADDSTLQKAGKLAAGRSYESGSFSILDGQIVAGGLEEPGPARIGNGNVLAPKVVLTNANGVVRNALCVGFDCPDAPAFGDSSILMMENNNRIKFGDTSNSPFPNNDWEIEANSATSGGLSYLGFNDCGTADNDGGCATDLVFAVEAGARQNALYVESDGDVGIGTSNPVVDLHVVTGNTPTLRLEQDSSSGFAAQTWDIAGNETNFFVRDVTGGSRLPFRIRPGAPTSSIDIANDGDVGIGTASPEAKLHVENGSVLVQDTTNPGFRLEDDDGTGASVWNFQLDANGLFQISRTGTGGPEVLIRQRADGTGGLETMDVDGSIEADAFNLSSSRTFKTGLEPVDTREVLSRVLELPVSEWMFKWDERGTRHIGPMAEDFLALFGVGNDSTNISVGDSAGVALAAIQGLHDQVRERDEAIEDLKADVEGLRALIQEFAEGR